MNNSQTNSELPSKAKLVKSTLLSIVIAGIILVTAVLPAEYGIDPTGIGSALGLTSMGEIKTALHEEAVERIRDFVKKELQPLAVQSLIDSPIRGAEGNKEFLALISENLAEA